MHGRIFHRTSKEALNKSFDRLRTNVKQLIPCGTMNGINLFSASLGAIFISCFNRPAKLVQIGDCHGSMRIVLQRKMPGANRQ